MTHHLPRSRRLATLVLPPPARVARQRALRAAPRRCAGARGFALLSTALLLACSGTYDFAREGAEAHLVVDEVGLTCELSSGAPRADELIVESSSSCGEEGVCLGVQGESLCSCRCDAPPGVPTCRCPSGFACSAHLLDLRLPHAPDEVGSYCAPVSCDGE